MTTLTLVSLEQYLNTTYEPDAEYVDGELRERNVGETGHGLLQAEIAYRLRVLGETEPMQVMTEARMHSSTTSYRIPDISVVLGDRELDRYLCEPPFLCVEILSPDDRAWEIQERIDEYIAFGIPYIWIVNPRRRRGTIYQRGTVLPAGSELITRDPDLKVDLEDVFRRVRL